MSRVSVVLCSYNQLPYVREAVESVLAQTYDDYELIAIDNGSTDGSQDVLREYAGNSKVRLVLHTENAPITKRFNEGVRLATGEFVAFLYSDDLFTRTKLELQVAEFDRLDASYGVVNGRAYRFDEYTGRRWWTREYEGTGEVLGPLLRSGGAINMLSPLARRECFARYPFYEDVFAEGEAAFLKVAMTYKFGFVAEPVVLLRDHASNRGRAIRRNVEMTLDALDRLVAHSDFPRACANDALLFRRSVLRTAGWSTVRLDGDVAFARECFREAIKVDWREATNVRTFLGLALSHVPPGARARLNKVGHRLRRTQGNKTPVAGYGGADATGT
jgi:glycosyltransferase involved in cell wall biosynthesis